MNVNALNKKIEYQYWTNIEEPVKFYSEMVHHKEVFSDINFINHFIKRFENNLWCWFGLIIFTKLDIKFISKMYEPKFLPHLRELLEYLTFLYNDECKNNVVYYRGSSINEQSLNNIKTFINEYKQIIK